MAFEPTQDMIDAAGNVFLAMTHLEIVRPIVEQYQREILGRLRFTNKFEFELREKHDSAGRWADLEVEVILEPKQAYRMSKEDFAVYDLECRRARDEAGLAVDEEDNCPLCEAESLLARAKAELVESLEPVTGASLKQLRGDHFTRYVELGLKLLAPFVNTRDLLKPTGGQA